MSLKIAQISPLFESVPPRLYGGTERVVSYLTEALVEMGHDVTLFASGDSKTKARLIPGYYKSLRLGSCNDPLALHVLQLQEVAERANEFDILHFHTDYLHFPLSRLLKVHTVNTLHGRLDIPELKRVYSKFLETPVVSISEAQRRPLPMARWAGNVPHGLPEDLYRKGDGKGDYVLFLGRISPEKRPDRAIEIAGRAGCKIRLAAKVDDADRQYYEQKIKPLLQLRNVEFIGEVGEEEKSMLLRDARALLFPIDWPEPFGMVMIEALACGTPVVAFNHGSVPEVIRDGKTGFIVDSIEEAVMALLRIDEIDRNLCRQEFEERFSATRMAQNYVTIYKRLLQEQPPYTKHRLMSKEDLVYE